MGLAKLAATEVSPEVSDGVSQVPDQADKPVPNESVAEERPVDDELDVLSDLGDEIATLAAHIHAATYRLLS